MAYLVLCTDCKFGMCCCLPKLQLHTQQNACVSIVCAVSWGQKTVCYATGEPVGWLRVRALSIPPWRRKSDLHHCGHGAELCGQQQCEPVIPIRSTSDCTVKPILFKFEHGGIHNCTCCRCCMQCHCVLAHKDMARQLCGGIRCAQCICSCDCSIATLLIPTVTCVVTQLAAGQFGTRLQGGKDSASARYIFTRMTKLTRHLFNAFDDRLLNYLNEEGQQIEPEW